MPSKIQFDRLAVSWAETRSDSESVTDVIVKQTYRLSFDHCAANVCKRNCIGNPRCLSALGGAALLNHSMNKLREDPTDARNCDMRRLSEPAGLRNLGATCYLNSLLQVWFHNAKFRDVILKWNRNLDCGEQKMSGLDSPETIVGHIQLIFVRLLKSIRRSVDPTALVEVLGLDTEYQQDASECCGLLFNVILDQLRMYSDGALAKELADAYRGKQATVIECENCGAVKRCEQDFYNMILNVQGHRDVRQCVKSLAQRRKIEGDFTCGTCASKKGAVTYEEFTEMPPALNLQLMRYRYDSKTGTKKKVQTPLRFPEILDVGPYIKDCSREKLYALRAVLVHVGHSANSGHYIANVRTGSDGLWFRLSDENVSVMKGRPDLSAEASKVDENKLTARPRKNGFENAERTLNGDDSAGESFKNDVEGPAANPAPNGFNHTDGEADAAWPVDSLNTLESFGEDSVLKNKRSKQQKNSVDKATNDDHTFTSTGAYMLVYERVDTKDVKAVDAMSPEPALHDYLEKIIQREHSENTKMAETIESIRSESTLKAEKLLTDFRRIISVLPYREGEAYRFVDTSNLTKVLKGAERLFRRLCDTIEQPMAPNPVVKNDPSNKIADEVVSKSFACAHGRLTPEGGVLSKLKVISSMAASLLDDFCVTYELDDMWKPQDSIPQELCHECVSQLGIRVAQLSQLQADFKTLTGLLKNKDSEENFWVDSKSLQNWPKLAEDVILAATGAKSTKPAEFRFNQQLQCVHGNLGLFDKKMVPSEAWMILRKWFPSCVVFPTSSAECEKCLNQSNKEKAIASERANTMLLLRQSLKGLIKFRQNTVQNDAQVYAIHVDQAMRIRKYLRAVTRCSEIPTNLSNPLICSHGNSLVFANDGILPENVVLLTLEESIVLRKNCFVDSFVRIQKSDLGLEVSPDPCEACLQLRMLEDQRARLDFENIEIPVVKLSFEELLQKHTVCQNICDEQRETDTNDDTDKPSIKRPRIGRRIPNSKAILLSSSDTFVDLKVKIMAKHHITPILQVILSGDKLLKDIDGGVKIREIGVRADSILYVAEDVLREDLGDTESKKNTKEEVGFGGTKLMG